MARPAPTCLDDDDRLRFPPVSPAQDSKAGKKESTGRRQSRLCPLSAKPSSNSSLDHRRSDARTAENGSATLSGVSKSAKVVLGRVLINVLWTRLSMQPVQDFAGNVLACFGVFDNDP